VIHRRFFCHRCCGFHHRHHAAVHLGNQPRHARTSGLFLVLLTPCPTMQNLVLHLPQFLDDAPLGFRRFLDIPACVSPSWRN